MSTIYLIPGAHNVIIIIPMHCVCVWGGAIIIIPNSTLGVGPCPTSQIKLQNCYIDMGLSERGEVLLPPPQPTLSSPPRTPSLDFIIPAYIKDHKNKTQHVYSIFPKYMDMTGHYLL